MSVSGPQAMRALDDALRDIRREEDEITRRIARANERVSKLRETELGQLRALAAIRLSPDVQKELAGPLSQVEARARDMLKEHASAMAGMEKALAEQETKLTRLTNERHTLLEEAARHQAQIDALGDTVNATLNADTAYGTLLLRRNEAQGVAEEAARKAEQAEADREEKGRPYRDDILFMYLWQRGYGTSAYKAGNIVRMLDQWVARLIRFADMRPNYSMLTAIPDRLREHAERLATEVIEIEALIEERENAALDAAGGATPRAALAAAQKRVDAIDVEILAAEDARDELAERQKHLAEGGDPAMGKAVDLLAGAISDTRIEKLLEEARATRTEEDDAIVLRIEETRRRISEEHAELDEERVRLKTLELRRRELEDIEFEFKNSRYDDPRSRFDDKQLVGDMLTEFLKGGMTAAAYWAMWRNSQGWSGRSGPTVPSAPPRTRSSNRSDKGGKFPPMPGGLPPRSPSGGGFSRPRGGNFGGGGFKTGGGFKGGGFKTGGGF